MMKEREVLGTRNWVTAPSPPWEKVGMRGYRFFSLTIHLLAIHDSNYAFHDVCCTIHGLCFELCISYSTFYILYSIVHVS